MTATPAAKPVNVTHMPTVHRVPAHAASPAAPVVNRAPATPLPPRTGAPITGGVVTRPSPPVAAAAPRPSAPVLPPVARVAPPVARLAPPAQHRPHVMPPQYASGYPQSRPPHHHDRPAPYQSSRPNMGNVLLGLAGIGLIAGIANAFRSRRPSNGQAPYGQAPYGQQQESIADSMTPSKFTSFLNAAIEGRENDRTAVRSGQTIPTSPIERQYFKQLAYLMMKRDGKQVDPQGMFTPEVLADVQSGRMDPRMLGSDVGHFSSTFATSMTNGQNQSVQNPLASDLYANYDYLRTQYASEYRQTQEQERRYSSEPRMADYSRGQYSSNGAPYGSAPYSSAPRSTIIPLFRI